MPRQVVRLVLDQRSDLRIEAVAPISVRLDPGPPHAILVKAKVAQLSGTDVWLRLDHGLARKLVDRLSEALRASAPRRTGETAVSLTFRRVLNGAANPATGRMVLDFEGESGRRYRVEVPRDQSGLLVDVVRLAAEKAGETGERDVSRDAGATAGDESAPVELEVVSLHYDPLIKREVLSARLPNSLEYFFALTERQAQQLRESNQASENQA